MFLVDKKTLMRHIHLMVHHLHVTIALVGSTLTLQVARRQAMPPTVLAELKGMIVFYYDPALTNVEFESYRFDTLDGVVTARELSARMAELQCYFMQQSRAPPTEAPPAAVRGSEWDRRVDELEQRLRAADDTNSAPRPKSKPAGDDYDRRCATNNEWLQRRTDELLEAGTDFAVLGPSGSGTTYYAWRIALRARLKGLSVEVIGVSAASRRALLACRTEALAVAVRDLTAAWTSVELSEDEALEQARVHRCAQELASVPVDVLHNYFDAFEWQLLRDTGQLVVDRAVQYLIQRIRNATSRISDVLIIDEGLSLQARAYEFALNVRAGVGLALSRDPLLNTRYNVEKAKRKGKMSSNPQYVLLGDPLTNPPRAPRETEHGAAAATDAFVPPERASRPDEAYIYNHFHTNIAPDAVGDNVLPMLADRRRPREEKPLADMLRAVRNGSLFEAPGPTDDAPGAEQLNADFRVFQAITKDPLSVPRAEQSSADVSNWTMEQIQADCRYVHLYPTRLDATRHHCFRELSVCTTLPSHQSSYNIAPRLGPVNIMPGVGTTHEARDDRDLIPVSDLFKHIRATFCELCWTVPTIFDLKSVAQLREWNAHMVNATPTYGSRVLFFEPCDGHVIGEFAWVAAVAVTDGVVTALTLSASPDLTEPHATIVPLTRVYEQSAVAIKVKSKSMRAPRYQPGFRYQMRYFPVQPANALCIDDIRGVSVTEPINVHCAIDANSFNARCNRYASLVQHGVPESRTGPVHVYRYRISQFYAALACAARETALCITGFDEFLRKHNTDIGLGTGMEDKEVGTVLRPPLRACLWDQRMTASIPIPRFHASAGPVDYSNWDFAPSVVVYERYLRWLNYRNKPRFESQPRRMEEVTREFERYRRTMPSRWSDFKHIVEERLEDGNHTMDAELVALLRSTPGTTTTADSTTPRTSDATPRTGSQSTPHFQPPAHARATATLSRTPSEASGVSGVSNAWT